MDIEEEERNMFGGRANTSKVFPKEMRKRDNQDDQNTKSLLNPKPSATNNTDLDIEAIGWLEKVLMGEQLFDAYSQTTYVCILMDLLAYEHINLTNKAFNLLMKFFNQRNSLVDLLNQIQLLEKPESIIILKRVNRINSDLKTFIEVINQWVDEENQSTKNIIDISSKLINSKESIDYLASILVEKHNSDRRGTLEDIPNTGRSVEESLVVGMNGRIMKRKEISDKDLVPNTENQKIMRNAGISDILLQILKISLSKSQKKNEDYQDIVRSIYLFLIRFCTNDVESQNLLSENMDFFLNYLDDCSLVIFLIKEILKDNKGFIAIKRQEVVRYIMKKEAKLSDGSVQKQHYLIILKTLSKNHNKNSKKTSSEILSLISIVDKNTIN